MTAEYLQLENWQVASAAGLIIVNGLISTLFQLGLAKTLVWASIRTVAQLTLVGFVLSWVFELDSWYLVLTLLVMMTLTAGFSAKQRVRRSYPGIWLTTIISMWASSWLVTGFALFVVLRGIEKWYQPQYAIPLAGMVLGNTLNGISIGLNSFLESIVTQRGQIEMRLALGANRFEAALPCLRNSIRSGMIPIINSMMVVGIVSLPGMMTGQILSGAAPLDAVKYQIVVMFLIASATALGTVAVVALSFFRVFSKDHRLNYHVVT